MNKTNLHTQQRGAALVIGLVLLVILTLLAVTGMNTASTELVMAGNEQYRQNAFQASETGIEQAMMVLSTLPQTAVPTVVAPVVIAGTTDEYTTTTTYRGEDSDIPGFSAGKFIGFHYEIDSTGTSRRNATAAHEQGSFVIAGGAGGSVITQIGGGL
ncbi:MAG: PilX N-terminal domain-containing pilus assembly protein [Steroidobacteraceae bacterium]